MACASGTTPSINKKFTAVTLEKNNYALVHSSSNKWPVIDHSHVGFFDSKEDLIPNKNM